MRGDFVVSAKQQVQEARSCAMHTVASEASAKIVVEQASVSIGEIEATAKIVKQLVPAVEASVHTVDSQASAKNVAEQASASIRDYEPSV